MAGSLYKGKDLFSGYDVASNVGTTSSIDISTIVSSQARGQGAVGLHGQKLVPYRVHVRAFMQRR